MNSMVMLLAMSAGQGPGGGAYPGPPGTFPVVPTQGVGRVPSVLPGTLPMSRVGQPVPGMQPPMPMTQPMTQPPSGMGGLGGSAVGEEKKPGEEDKEEEEKKKDEGPPVYLLGRTLRETWLGKKMADDGYRLYGWTAMSYTLGTTSISNAPMFFNDRPNHYQMNQNWIHFEKSIDPTKSERQWGFVTDSIVPGTDARTTIARGLFDQQLRQGPLSPNGAVPPSPVGNSVPYPFDLYQFYGQVFLPNLGGKGTTVKVGRFATHCEYEVVQAVDTPFVSKSYLFEYNPFTHTGVWAVTQLNDTWAVGNGMVLGSDNFIDPANRPTYLGQVKWAPPDGKTSVLLNAVVILTGPTFDVAENFPFYNVYNLQVTHKFTDKFSYVLDGAFSHMNGIPGVGGTNWYGLANYFFYKFTDKLTGIVRAEVFEDTNGVRTGFAGLYTEATAGVAWSPKPGLIFRPSVRYDTNSTSRPFEGDHSMWTGAFEMIFRW